MEDLHETEWNGYKKIEFTVGGRLSYIVCPETEAPGKPWVWRCEFFGAFDSVDRALLKQGWHLAYHKVSDMYGCPEAVAMMHEFQTEVCETFGLSRQPALFGFSRGGLYAVNYALTYPYEVSLLYLDAPVLNIADWPCGMERFAREGKECMDWFHLTPETLQDFRGNPIDHAEEIAVSQIPVIIVAGAADTVVHWDKNGKIFDARLREHGGIVHTIVKPECDHHPHSLSDPRPVTDFINAHTDFAPALPNTLYRLKRDKQLTVAYFGGSITEGGGENGWRGCNTAWLRTQYPDAEITEVHAAIGGTGSYLGVFRCERDVLAYNPDLVYIEFAVNDYHGWQDTSVNMESIIRKIRENSPYTEIVLVFTLTKTFRDNLDSGTPFRSRDLQMRLARRYGLPTVNIGDALWRVVKRDYAGDWTQLAPDTVHPNTKGYAPCAAEMQAFMEDALRGDIYTLHTYTLPEPLNESLRMSARMEDASAAHTDGFVMVEESLCGRYPHYMEGDAGSFLTLEFFGDTIGVYWMMAKDSGMIEYRIDGGEWKKRSAWDTYCPRFSRAKDAILAADLEPQKHTLEIRVLSEKPEESEGCRIRIGAFLVS